jgi:hypothetical protein
MAGGFVRGDENALLNATVSTTVGATDADYTDEWIADGRLGRPVRATNGTATWSLSFSSAQVGIVAVCNCTANVNATIGGGVSATVTAGALGDNGIRLNGFATVTPASITTLTVGFSGASSAVVLGEVIAGRYRSLPIPSFEIGFDDYALDPEAEFSSINGHDRGLESRVFTGTMNYSTANRDTLMSIWRGQRANTRPTLMVYDDTINDAVVGFLEKPSYQQVGPTVWRVNVTFREIPRGRW